MKINIKFNKFLEPVFVAYAETLPKPERWTFPTQEEVSNGLKMYQETWALVGDKIITDIEKITGLSFTQNVIDVHIVSVNPRAFSNPIVMKSRYSKEDFISTLTEELTHSLFKEENNPKFQEVFAKIKEKYPRSDRIVNHILVFSIMEKIGVKPFVNKDPEYIEALEIAKDKDWVVGLFK